MKNENPEKEPFDGGFIRNNGISEQNSTSISFGYVK